MNKNSMLLIGCGKTGNVLVDGMISKDKRYVGLQVNSAIGDMANLKNYEIMDHFLFAGQDGSGRDRNVAKEFVKKRINALIDILIKYNDQKTVCIFCSSDGGTGSGSSLLIAKALKKVCPDKTVMIIAVIPKLTENEISLKNATGFWNDLIDAKNKKIIDTIYLIDNNKRDTYEAINKEAINALDMAFSLNSYDTTGTIDQNDSKRVNTAQGYNFIMPLETECPDLKTAVDICIKKSVFLIPPSYDCDYLGAVVQQKYFNVDELKENFNVFKVDYCGYSDSTNLIVLSGLPVPREAIDILQVALKDVEDKGKKKYKETDLYVRVKDEVAVTKENSDKNTKDKNENKSSNTSTISSQELDAMIDGDFWDN